MKKVWKLSNESLLVLALACTVFCQLFLILKFTGPINSILFLNLGFSDFMATVIDNAFAIISIILLGIYILKKNIYSMSFISLWLLLIPVSILFLHSSFGYTIMIGAHAARWMLPISLVFFTLKKNEIAESVLRIAIASTFVFHGLEAWWQHPNFADYIYTFFSYFNIEISSDTLVRNFLYIIAVADFLSAALIVLNNNRYALWYALIWGFITAFFRVFYYGDLGIVEFFIRAPHFLIPIYLLKLNYKFKFSPEENLAWQN